MFCNCLDPEYKLIYSKKLTKQSCFFEEDGVVSEPVLRQGILTDSLYKNRKYISTINGKSEFLPIVEIYNRVYTDLDSIMIINVWDKEKNQVIKQMTINSKPNGFDIVKMKDLFESYKTICESKSGTEVIDLIKQIKFNEEDIKFEEYC